MKTVAVNLPGTGKWSNVEIAPGATARDVLSQLGLGTDYRLCRWHDTVAFGERENIYTALADGEKVQAVSAAEVALVARRRPCSP